MYPNDETQAQPTERDNDAAALSQANMALSILMR